MSPGREAFRVLGASRVDSADMAVSKSELRTSRIFSADSGASVIFLGLDQGREAVLPAGPTSKPT